MNKRIHRLLFLGAFLIPLLGATALNARRPPAEKQSMDWIGFQQFEEVSRVFVRTTDKVKFKIDSSRPRTIILVLQNTYIDLKNNRRELPTQFFDSPVRKITTRSVEGPSPSTYVEIHLRRPTTFQKVQKGNTLALDFAR